MNRTQIGLLSGAGFAFVLAAGVAIGRYSAPKPSQAAAPAAGRKVLYWYDPMVPAQHFDKPGKSPFMDMQLVPKYAGEAETAGSIRIDPARAQNLGLRLAAVERGVLPSDTTVAGTIDFDERDVAVVQARSAGFVQRVYARAPGDVIAAGAPLVDLLIPEWAGAQTEYLAVKKTGDGALIRAARQRLQLLGMPASVIEAVDRDGKVRNTTTIATPAGGMIKTLSVRSGMTVSAGQTLAEINGLSKVWLNAAVPEAQAGAVRVGQTAIASLAAFPGETFTGTVTAILPQAQAESRTLTARIELPNRGRRLRPGMFAEVQFGGGGSPALLVPSEALIRTGKRTLVMVAGEGGRFTPAEVRVGRESGGRSEVLSGLAEGEKVVASGQFLIDSEASLSGVQARSAPPAAAPPAASTLIRSEGRIEQITTGSVTLSHGPIPQIGWPAMTMTFALASPSLAQGLKPGQRVAFAFEQGSKGPIVRELQPVAAP
jgi:Cu(I)/Ag(I) efflux system membrane fusion protein